MTPANLGEAVAASCEPLEVIATAAGDRWFCVVIRGEVKVGVELAEEVPGSGDWSVTGVEVRPVSGMLSVGMLRDAPYGDVIRTARAEVLTTVDNRPNRVFGSPSDPPVAFRADRRGRTARTEKDFARLAQAYLALHTEKARERDMRRRAASLWGERFPGGGSKRTWANRLVQARRYVETVVVDGKEEEVLSDDGMALVYGDDWRAMLEFDTKWGGALNVATMRPGGETWRNIERDGKDPRKWKWAAQQRIRVDGEGESFATYSPQTPQ